jgi:clan AA aspartic protease
MIVGMVSADLQPIIRLTVFAPDGTHQAVEALVDSGFNGWLTLPPAIIAALGLSWFQRGRAVLADGNSVVFDTYEGAVDWDGTRLTLHIDESDGGPLVGMELMRGYELNLLAVPGGRVTIRWP